MKKGSFQRILRADHTVAVLCAALILGGCGEKGNESDDKDMIAETETEAGVVATGDDPSETGGQDDGAVPETVICYSTSGDSYLASKESALAGIPYDLTDEDLEFLMPDGDIYYIGAGAVIDDEWTVPGKVLDYDMAGTCIFSDDGYVTKQIFIYIMESDADAADVCESLLSSLDNLECRSEGNKVYGTLEYSRDEGQRFADILSYLMESGDEYGVITDNGKLQGSVRDEARATLGITGSGSGSGATSHSGNPSGSLAEVFVYDDTHADFVFYGDGSVEMPDITGLSISFGNYQAGLNDFGGGDLQCSIWIDSGNGSHSICNEGVADYNIDSDGITIHVDMSGVPGFSFGDISGDCDVHYESGGNGGPVITLAWDDVVNPERYTAQSQTTQNGNNAGNGATAGQDDRGQAQTGTESAVNTILSQAAGHYVQGNGLGSLDLVDHGNGSYSLENIHVVYKVQVGEFPNTQWEDREWRGSTGSFGDGNGARNGGDGIVRLTLNLIDGNKTVTITSQGGIAIDNDDGSGLDFVKVD